jgi:RNA polymerase sigma factor (sigma-70 family)
MTDKEKSLIRGCLRGEKAPWDAFVTQYSNLVYHTVRKTLTLHHADCADEVIRDLYQEFFLSVNRENFKKLRQFRGDRGCSLASWVRLVTTRLVIDFLRRQRSAMTEAIDSASLNGPDVTDLVINQEQKQLLLQALQMLSPKEQILINLCYRKGLSAEECAPIFNTTVSGFYTQKSRVLSKLRELLTKTAPL